MQGYAYQEVEILGDHLRSLPPILACASNELLGLTPKGTAASGLVFHHSQPFPGPGLCVGFCHLADK